MLDQNDALQRGLEDLESGVDLGSTFERNRGEDGELIQLAAAIRSLPHPTPSPEIIRTAHQTFWHVSSRSKPQVISGMLGKNGKGLDKEIPMKNQSKVHSISRNTMIPAFVVLTALCLMAIVTAVGIGTWFFLRTTDVHAAKLMDATGQVELASANSDAWQQVSNGEKIHTGDRLRTGNTSNATILFSDGSQTTIASNSDITFSRIDGGDRKLIRIVLTQNAGNTSHSVAPFTQRNSLFMVYTPTGAASVHGTRFNVTVGTGGESEFSVLNGKVLVTNHNSELYLNSGQAIEISAYKPMEEPAYQFQLEGTLSEKADLEWSVQGVKFNVTPETDIEGDPQPEDTIEARGLILTSGVWVATKIEPSDPSQFEGKFTGEVNTIGEGSWLVGNKTIIVNEYTKYDQGITAGDIVEVKFTLDSEIWIANKIDLLDDKDEPKPTTTPDPDANPFLEFTPDHLEAATCETSLELTGTLSNTSEDPEDNAMNIDIGYQVTKGAEFVNLVELDPQGWESITAGEQVDFAIKLEMNPETWESASPDQEIELRVFIVDELNNLKGHEARLIVVVKPNCGVTPEPTVPPDDDEGTCVGVENHPTGMKLADRYAVPYEEIMGWFCQHFGFGEIDLAYGLSMQYDIPATDIFALRMEGIGWGVIKQMLKDGWTPTPDASETPSPSPEPSETPEPPQDNNCTGNHQPTGQRLADFYHVTYEEIMGWFCAGFGFGEIDLAYGLAEQYHVDVGEIFSLRSSGMGWGQIKRHYEEINPPPTENPPEETPPPASDHGKNKPPKKGGE